MARLLASTALTRGWGRIGGPNRETKLRYAVCESFPSSRDLIGNSHFGSVYQLNHENRGQDAKIAGCDRRVFDGDVPFRRRAEWAGRAISLRGRAIPSRFRVRPANRIWLLEMELAAIPVG